METRTALTAIALAAGLAVVPEVPIDEAAATSSAVTAAVTPAAAPATDSAAPAIRIVGAYGERVALVDWALGRFEDAGLVLPSIEIRFYGDLADCDRNMGRFWTSERRIDICGRKFNTAGKKTILHELAHAWAHSHVSREQRDAFLELRGLEVWSGSDTPWELRGTEHAAAIVAWALLDRTTLVPRLPDTEPHQLRAAYELLTGTAPGFRDADPDDQP